MIIDLSEADVRVLKLGCVVVMHDPIEDGGPLAEQARDVFERLDALLPPEDRDQR